MCKWLGLVAILAIFLVFVLKEQKPAPLPISKVNVGQDNQPHPKPPAPAPMEFNSKPSTRPLEKADAAISPTTKAANSDPVPKFIDIALRDDQGGLQKMNNAEAKRACSSAGMRLPTILELARYAQTRGAKGVTDADQVREQDLLDGYERIIATNPNGVREVFYYNPKGFAPAADVPGKEIYWSSSTCVGCVQGSGGDSIHTLNNEGRIHNHYDYISGAVRCIQYK